MRRMVHKIKKYLKVIKALILISIHKATVYRLSFFMTTITIAMWLGAYLIWYYILFHYTSQIGGYNSWQYIGFLGFYQFTINVFWFWFSYGLYYLSDNIYDGKVDYFIVKPISSQFLASISELDIPSFFNMILGLSVYILALIKVNSHLTIISLLEFIIVFICSILIFYSFFFCFLISSFWLGRMQAIRGFFVKSYNDTSTVPTGTFQGVLKFILYFIFPVAVTTTIPTSILYFGIKWQLIFYYIIFTIGILLASMIVWKVGLKSYSSVSG